MIVGIQLIFHFIKDAQANYFVKVDETVSYQLP